MEIVIVICLLIVIALLLQDKIVIKTRSKHSPKQEKANPNLPDIMGQPKLVKSPSVPNTTNEIQIQKSELNPANLDIEYDNNEIVGIQIPQEEIEAVFSNIPDFKEEEEEWYSYDKNNNEEIGLAQGVTFEELMVVGDILNKEKVAQVQQQKLTLIIDKLHGTELYHLLENSMQNNVQKIASLLENNLSIKSKAHSAPLQKKDITDFNIDEFI